MRNSSARPPAAIWPDRPPERVFERIDQTTTVALPRTHWRLLMVSCTALFVLLIVCLIWIAMHSQGMAQW